AFAAVPGPPTTTADGSPSARAAVSSSYVTFLTSPSTWSTRTSTSLMSSFLVCRRSMKSDDLLGHQVLGDLRATVAFVGDLLTGGPRRLRRRLQDGGPGIGEAELGRVDVEVGDGQGLHRLLLGGHDALERRVARLVDLLGHADHGGQVGLEVGDAVLGLTVDLDGVALDRHGTGVGELRHAEQFGQHRGHGTAAAVGGLVTGDD